MLLTKIIGIGRINAISTSKIKNMMAIKKNFRENGFREDELGSNPHSKGDIFSRSLIILKLNKELTFIKIIDRNNAARNNSNISLF